MNVRVNHVADATGEQHLVLARELAHATPNAVAIACAGATLGYAELNRRANRLARHLRQLSVGPGTRVGACA